MLLHTVQKPLALSLVKVKVKFTQTEVYKDSPLEKIDPLRSNPAPSPTVPLLHCPHGPSMPRFSPPLQTLHPSDNQGRASTSHVGGLAALLVLKVVLIGKGTRTLLDVDKDCDDGDPSSTGWLVEGAAHSASHSNLTLRRL